jgi:hypothetical protein
VLIDFGFAQQYRVLGVHMKQKKTRNFIGNLAFASHNAFNKISLSRRDDLISMCYLLVFLFNGKRTWEQEECEVSPISLFTKVSTIKKSMMPLKLCVGSSRKLLPFTEEVFKYGFSETPDYSKLKFLLSKVLLDQDITPNLFFDWSRIPRQEQIPSQPEKKGAENVRSAANENSRKACKF